METGEAHGAHHHVFHPISGTRPLAMGPSRATAIAQRAAKRIARIVGEQLRARKTENMRRVAVLAVA